MLLQGYAATPIRLGISAYRMPLKEHEVFRMLLGY